jgi:hypothetical protein
MTPCFACSPAWAAQHSPPPLERRRAGRRATFRPLVEALEAREVPAVNTWLGTVSTDFDTAANWSLNAVPEAGDDIVFEGVWQEDEGGGAMSSLMGGGESNLIPPGGGYVSADCEGMHGAAGGDYHSVTLDATYTGRVTLDGDVVTGNFNLAGGTIDQPDLGTGPFDTEITVTESFNWTGGTLNSTPNDANVNIQGAGNIAIPTDGTLYCGSTLNFTNPTAAAVETLITGAGTLLQTGGTGIYVGTNAGVHVVSSPNAAVGIGGDNKTLTLAWGSYWGHEGSGTAPMAHRVINEGGRFYLKGQVTLTMTGGDANTPAYTQNAGVWPFTPKLEIQNGCIMDVSASKGVLINGGQVWLVGNAPLGVAGQVATIKGNFEMTYGTIGFDSPILIGEQQTPTWGLFKVDGNATWSGGTFLPGVDCAYPGPGFGSCNGWTITGTLTIDASKPDKPTIGPVPQNLAAGQQPWGKWTIIGSPNIVGDTPTIPQGWFLDTTSNGDGKKIAFTLRHNNS